MSEIFDSTIGYLRQGLNTSLRRQVVLHGNIANLDTPGFTPQDVNFDAAMQSACLKAGIRLEQTSPTHIQGTEIAPINGPIYERPDTEPGLDGNSVDLDMQMARLSQNSILYKASARLISKKLAILKYVVSEGGA